MDMNIKRLLKIIIAFCLLLSLIFYLFSLSGSKDLTASVAQIPGLADSPEKGLFIDLIKAIDEVYTEGKIKIEIYPFVHSINNITEGKKDFHIPYPRTSDDESTLPYRIVSEKMGEMASVLYSNVDKKLTTKMLNDAIKKGGEFPYKIESAGGTEGADTEFPRLVTNNLEQSLLKLSNKRIDGIIWTQEEVDMLIKKMKLKNIYRSYYQALDDVIITVKGSRGEEIDKILSTAIRKLKTSGRWKTLYSKIHRPYDNWQPSKMGW